MVVSGSTSRPGQLYPRKGTLLPIEREAVCVPQSVWALVREKSLAAAGNLTPYRPDRSLVTIVTELSRLLSLRHMAVFMYCHRNKL